MAGQKIARGVQRAPGRNRIGNAAIGQRRQGFLGEGGEHTIAIEQGAIQVEDDQFHGSKVARSAG